MHPRRTTRQRRLVEVGEAGQARLAALAARVAGAGIAARVEALYLAGAGVGALVVEDDTVAEAARALNPEVDVRVEERVAAPAEVPSDIAALAPGARDVAEGALRALLTLRGALLHD